MADRCTGLFDFFLRKANCNAHLQCRRDDLLGLEVVFQSLEAGDENAIGEALNHVRWF